MNAKLSCENPDWYSPLHLVEAARALMGGIDIDPASDAEANERIKAAVYYDEDTDGLVDEHEQHRAWNGRVFLNPPSGQVAKFWVALVRNYLLGNTSEALWVGYSLEQLQSLQNPALYEGFQSDAKTFPQHYAMCFPAKRLQFDENAARRESRHAIERVKIARGHLKRKLPRERPTSPTHANYLVYLGPQVDRFVTAFGELFGVCVVGEAAR